MKLAVVLGAGGTGGWAFHLGVTRAMTEVFGRSVADADLVVGTSAGAAIGASLRLGASTEEVLTSVTTPPTSQERAAIQDQTGSRRSGLGRFLPLSPTLALRGLANPRRAGLVMAGALPGGFFPTMGLSRFPRIQGHVGWPEGLLVTSVRVRDGALVVFGRDRTDVSLADALEASSAVPGMFRPKDLDGELFVDGATASANHADLAAAVAPDLVVVSSVQSRPGVRASRVLARRQLPRELRALERAGARVALVEPDRRIAEAFSGFPRSTRDRGPEIVELIAEHVREKLAAV